MIYYVEDEKGIRELVLYTLRNSGYEAEGFEESGAFYRAVAKEKPSLILLDIMLPGEDGLLILRHLRQSAETRKLPIIMVTAMGTEFDKVTGLDLGADDYITKPFGMMEMVSRVKSLLRRTTETVPSQTICQGVISMDLSARTVLVGGVLAELTYKEFELLKLLMINAGTVISRETILDKVWGYDCLDETRTVDVHIRTLRQKLGPGKDLIKTVRSVGYRMENRKESLRREN